MDQFWKHIIWKQFGAAIDMLGRAIDRCPDDLWENRSIEFWYIAYHSLFWLDLYLHGQAEGFTPPAPFGLEELDPAGVLPDRVYTRAELKTYLEHCRKKCRATIDDMNEKSARETLQFPWSRIGMSRVELLLYNMRHVQHHAAQLYLLLRKNINDAPNWAAQAPD